MERPTGRTLTVSGAMQNAVMAIWHYCKFMDERTQTTTSAQREKIRGVVFKEMLLREQLTMCIKPPYHRLWQI